ncbi:MAG: 5-oxoprolinase subunit PxpB [Rhodanobacter sp.]|jgi:KipI family sensor histidine kinase inhibitor|nr:5-oxoprolinase subunit PxpB [Rhodanobacter sp.]
MNADERALVIEPLGETVLLLRFGDDIHNALNVRVHAAAALLRAVELPGIVDLVPAYATLALHYAPEIWIGHHNTPWRHLADAVRAVFATPPADAAPPTPALVEIPVCYGGDDGPDLAEVAHHCALRTDEVIAHHAAATYTVAMLGFAPGFPYLLGLDTRLHTPRRATPRTRVTAGSVAIGGAQTGIYPAELPGGWHLIGRTPLTLFDATLDPPCLLAAGDRVRFHAIDRADFDALARPHAR